jgi:hypothetical protein
MLNNKRAFTSNINAIDRDKRHKTRATWLCEIEVAREQAKVADSVVHKLR